MKSNQAIRSELELMPVALASFTSSLDDIIETELDLNKFLIKNRVSTFFFRVKGLSMRLAGIDNNDIAIVDRSMDFRSGDIVIAIVEGVFILKRFIKQAGVSLLVTDEERESSYIKVNQDVEIWGKVVHIIKSFT